MSKQLNEFLESEEGKLAEFAVNIRSASVKDYAERVELEVFKNIGLLLFEGKNEEKFQKAFECHYGKEPTESIEENMNWNEARVHFSRGWGSKLADVGESLTAYGEEMLDDFIKS